MLVMLFRNLLPLLLPLSPIQDCLDILLRRGSSLLRLGPNWLLWLLEFRFRKRKRLMSSFSCGCGCLLLNGHHRCFRHVLLRPDLSFGGGSSNWLGGRFNLDGFNLGRFNLGRLSLDDWWRLVLLRRLLSRRNGLLLDDWGSSGSCILIHIRPIKHRGRRFTGIRRVGADGCVL